MQHTLFLVVVMKEVLAIADLYRCLVQVTAVASLVPPLPITTPKW
jgi:hypothetical protein